MAYSVPSHYLKQCWVSINWTLRNKLQWNFNWNTNLFIHENASENTVCKMAAILSRRDELSTSKCHCIRCGFLSQMASNVESISMSWHHHATKPVRPSAANPIMHWIKWKTNPSSSFHCSQWVLQIIYNDLILLWKPLSCHKVNCPGKEWRHGGSPLLWNTL